MSEPSISKNSGIFSSFDQTQIYYETRGNGPPMIFCYGLGCLINHWHPQIDFFSNTHLTVAWDYRAHHKSSKATHHEAYEIQNFVDDLLVLCDHLGFDQCIFWGHSFASQILISFAHQHPGRCREIILVNGFGSNPIDWVSDAQLDAILKWLLEFGFNQIPTTLTELWRISTRNPLFVPLSFLFGGFQSGLTPIKDIEIYMRGLASISPEIFTRIFRSMTAFDGRGLLPNIQIPTLVIGGSADHVTPLRFQKELCAGLPNGRLVQVPFGSHCSQLDMPELINESVVRFLDKRFL